MKLNTVIRYKQSALRYAYTLTPNPSGDPIREYYLAGPIAVTFIAQAGRGPRVYSDADLELFDIIDTVTDPSGAVIDDQSWYVNFKVPVLDAFGYVNGYAYNMTLVADQNN